MKITIELDPRDTDLLISSCELRLKGLKHDSLLRRDLNIILKKINSIHQELINEVY